MTISASLPGAARHGSGAATTRLWTAVADPGALSPLADLVCASAEEAAERARAALSHALRHDALVIVAPASDGLPVRIAASADLHERLASIDWSAIATAGAPYQKGVDRFAVPDVIAGLQVAGWAASSAGVEVLLLVLSAGRLEIGPAQEQAARLVTMLT